MSPGLTWLATLGFFAVLNAPSLKLLYNSELINVFAIGGIVYLGTVELLVDRSARMGRTALLVIGLNLALWTWLYVSVVWGQHTMLTLELLLRYTASIIAITAVAAFLRPKNAQQLAWVQAFWGGALGVLYLTGVVGLYRIPGQHYLTLGVPLAAAVLSSLGLLIVRPRPSRLMQLGLLGNAAFCLSVLASLLGRSPILFSAALLAFTAVVYVFTARTLLRRLFGAFGLLVVGSFASVLALRVLQERWIERFDRLASNVQAEPRYQIYTHSAHLIGAKPFGFGLGATFDLVGFYPHNIFLEIALSAGLLATLPLLAICWILLRRWVTAVSERSVYLPLCLVAMYMVLAWNVSFDLGTAYVPVGFAAAAIVATSRGERREGLGRDRDAKSSPAVATRAAQCAGPDASSR
jgi:O-antigen ligase